MKIAIINGPNLNMLGQREPQIYGSQSFESYFETLQNSYSNHTLTYYQSNIEGELVTAIQTYGSTTEAIIINPAAYSHTSIAIADAIAAVPCKVVEVHISNIFAREEYRKHSYVSSRVSGVITGLGLYGYNAAINYLQQP